MKNAIIRFFLQFLHKKRESGPLERILVVSTTGLGDSLWGTPAVHALRKALPEARITLLTSPIGAQVFGNSPDIDNILVYKRSIWLHAISLYRSLKNGAFDAVLLYHTSQRLVLPLCACTGAPIIIGTQGLNKGFDNLLTQSLPPKHQHEIERRLDITNALTPISSDGLMQITLSEEERAPFYNKPFIAIHPGSKDGFKRWDKRHFITVGKHLAKHTDFHIVITGNHEEKELAQAIAQEIPGAVHIAGKLPLRRFAGVLKECSLLITNDTGPMHLAHALETPVVALFTPTNPELCGPYKAKNAHTIQREKTCTPCLGKKCREPFCLEQISPEEVIEAINQMLHNPRP